MANITPQMMLSFQDELEKQAISLAGLRRAGSSIRDYLARQGTTAGSGAVLGGVTGGLGGAGLGAGKAYQEARESGATGREAATEGLMGAWKGLKGGALLGAGLGAGAGLAGGSRARGVVSKLRGQDNALGGLSRFGERQVHSLTGAVPRTAKGGLAGGSQVEAVRAMRGGSWDATNRLNSALEAYRNAAPGAAKDKALKQLKGARAWQDAATASEEMGITSLPGYLKAVVGKGKYVGGAKAGQKVKPWEAMKAGVKEQWHGTGTGVPGAIWKAGIFGMPAAAAASELATPSEYGDEGRLTRAGKALGGMAYGLAPIPIAGMTALGLGLERAGGLAGKGIERAAGKVPEYIDPEKARRRRSLGMMGRSSRL